MIKNRHVFHKTDLQNDWSIMLMQKLETGLLRIFYIVVNFGCFKKQIIENAV